MCVRFECHANPETIGRFVLAGMLMGLYFLLASVF